MKAPDLSFSKQAFSCTPFLVFLNYLLTLSLWPEDTFGPLTLTFMRDNDLGALGL